MNNYFVAWNCGSSDPTEKLDVLALHGPLNHVDAVKVMKEFHSKNIEASIIQINSLKGTK